MDIVLLTLGNTIDKTFFSFDFAIFEFFGNIQCGFLNIIAKIFTAFGDEAFVIPMIVLGAVLMLFKKTRKYGFALFFAIIVGTLITNVLVKPMALRIRPYNTLQEYADYMGWYNFAGAFSESIPSLPGIQLLHLKWQPLFSLFSEATAKRKSAGFSRLSPCLQCAAVCT